MLGLLLQPFLVEAGEGTEEDPFLTLNSNSTLKGVVFFYPKQIRDDVPKPYPYAIAMRGKNPAVLDVELLNPYNGIDASRNERHIGAPRCTCSHGSVPPLVSETAIAATQD